MNKLGILILGDRSIIADLNQDFFIEHNCLLYHASDLMGVYTVLEDQSISIVLIENGENFQIAPNIIKSIKLRHPDLEMIILPEPVKHASSRNGRKVLGNSLDSVLTSFPTAQEIFQSSKAFNKFRKHQEQLDLNFTQFYNELKEKNVQPMIGVSSAIKTISSLMLLVAKSEDTSVIITGESGTGKELVARGIHALSCRCSGPFNAVNCSAIPETLFESEFFGFRKGAFTGAMEKSMGWFELANNGTLFLDEVTELPLLMQGKLLRVLDDKTIFKIGSREEIKLNLRVVSATNKDIHQLLDRNTLRLDLFHRLNSFHIHIPPLRERREDIPILLDYYVKVFSKKQGKPEKRIDDQVVDKLQNHLFPGNVRELKNLIERAVITSDENILRARDFNIGTVRKAGSVANPLLKTLNLHEVERKTISDALSRCSYNITRAAALLSISRQRLYRKMEKLSIPCREAAPQ